MCDSRKDRKIPNVMIRSLNCSFWENCGLMHNSTYSMCAAWKPEVEMQCLIIFLLTKLLWNKEVDLMFKKLMFDITCY